MKVPRCSVCQIRYNEDDRAPLLLQCGHGFCKDCLFKVFAASSDTIIACPKCRHVSVVGNSVNALPKNYAIIGLLESPLAEEIRRSNSDCDFTDDDDDDEYTKERDEERHSSGSNASSSGGIYGGRIDLGGHREVKLLRKIGEGKRLGSETWMCMISSGAGRKFRHGVSVKKVEVVEGMDVEWMQVQLDNLQRASVWCRNVCTFHGIVKMDGCLGLVMDRCYGSVQSEMQRNEGRLTLEQILRYGADIARGVAELHAAGVICMNINPSNLLLDMSGHAMVSDYGLAPILKRPTCPKARSGCDSVKICLCMDCIMLSPHYTAPEVWEPVKKSLNLFSDEVSGICPEADAWSFGCTLVEMCTGSIPWAGQSAEEIYRSVVKARKLPPQYTSVVGVGIPRELWKMIGECLQFKATKRPSFNSMLGIFLRHLQELPRNASPSPAKCMLADAATINSGHAISMLLDAQNSDGLTALHLACRHGSAELVYTLLGYKELNVDVLDKDGVPPLVLAVASGSLECVRALIGRGANIRVRSREGFGSSIAHICARHGHPGSMLELLLAGADPNAVDDEGESVLHRAVATKHTDCALVLLENNGFRSMSFSNSKKLTPLHLCVETRNVAVVQRWLEVASPEEIALAIDIQSPVGTALCMAATLKKDHENEGRDMVRLLLSAGADPTVQDAQHGRTALHFATMANDAELVKIILDAGVDVDVRSFHNTTPLHVALARGANSCVGLLLSAGANCTLQDDEGNTAFHIATDGARMIRENLDWLVIMLRNPNTTIDIRNHRGMTQCDFLEALPREWISEDLVEALMDKGIHLSPTIFDVGDWTKFKRSVSTPAHGWQNAKHGSVGFVQSVTDKENLVVSFCTGEAHVLASEMLKVIPLDRGQHVQLKLDVLNPRFGWRGQSHDSIGTVLCIDEDGMLRIGFPGASRGWKADPAEMERVEEFKVGDWVRIRPTLTAAKHGLGSVSPGSIGIVYCIRPDGSLLLELSFLPSPWLCEPEEVEYVPPFRIGDPVCVKRSVSVPRYAWGGETHHSVGRVTEIENDGLLIIEMPTRPVPWQADPSDMEKLEIFKVGDWVRVRASVCSPKYGWEDVTKNSIGVIHSLEDDGDVGIAFGFRSKAFHCSVSDLEMVTPFEVDQEMRIVPSLDQPRLGWSNESHATLGKIAMIDLDGTLNVRVSGRDGLWKVSPGDAEQLSGFEVGDWVRTKPTMGNRPSYDWNTLGKESLAVVHSVQETGYLELTCCFRKGKWIAHCMDVEKVARLRVGQHVHFRTGMAEPRWGWRGALPNSRGIIASVHADGEVRVTFGGLQCLWRGDPSDLEIGRVFEVGEWVRLQEDAAVWKSIGPGSVGIVEGMEYEDEVDRTTHVSFCGENERWVGPSSHLEKAERFVVGQKIRVKPAVTQPRFGWSGHTHASVGVISAIDADGKLKLSGPAGAKAWMLDPSEVQPVEENAIHIGDWVKVRDSVLAPAYHWGEVNHFSLGVVHRIEERGELRVSFCFIDKLWLCKESEMERVRPFRVGDKVRIRQDVATPRWGWGMETHASKGLVVGVDANGKVRIRFQWREGKPWTGDPADIILDES